MVDSAANIVYYVDAVRHGAAMRAPTNMGTTGLAKGVLASPLTLGRSIFRSLE